MRSSLFARAGTAWVPALLVCLGAIGSAAGQSQYYEEFPQEASGEICFQVDGAILISAAGKPEAFLYVGIPQDDIVCQPVEGRGRDWASLRARLAFLNSAGMELAKMESALARALEWLRVLTFADTLREVVDLARRDTYWNIDQRHRFPFPIPGLPEWQ